MKIRPLSVALAVVSIAIVTSNASAQSNDQLRSCRDFVADRFDRVSGSDVQVSPGDQRPNGRSLVYWQVRNARASGFCVVNRRNEVVTFRQDDSDIYSRDEGVRYSRDRYSRDQYSRDQYSRDQYGKDPYGRTQDDRYGNGRDPRYGTYSGAEDDWGYRVRPYRAEIRDRGTTLVSRPDKTNKRDIARMDRGDEVLVYRTYQERDTGITWLFVRGSSGREGWVNARRVSQD